MATKTFKGSTTWITGPHGTVSVQRDTQTGEYTVREPVREQDLFRGAKRKDAVAFAEGR